MSIRSSPARTQPVDWRSPAWRRALERTLAVFGRDGTAEAVLDGEAVLVRCRGACGSGLGWHRVTWTDGGLTCDCPSRGPCVHRVRAWAEWYHDWRLLADWARRFGPAAAVAGVVWQETRDLAALDVRRVTGLRVERQPDGTVVASAEGAAVWPSGRFAVAFEYGYGGAGPHELAYVALAISFGPTLAEERRAGLVAALATVPWRLERFWIAPAALEAVARGAGVRFDPVTATIRPEEVS